MIANERIGDWVGMASGRKFWPLDPRPEEVEIEDIAQALSNLCRFGGHCSAFYSVAQHSVWVARHVECERPGRPLLALHALLHDAAEAYLGDVIRPLKGSMMVDRGHGVSESFEVAERRVMAAIYRKFGMPRLSDADRAIIKHADNVALATEARDLMGDPQWPGLPEPHPEPVEPWMPGWARRVFLLDVIRLNGADDRGAKRGGA